MKKFIMSVGVFFMLFAGASAAPKVLVIDWSFMNANPSFKAKGMTVLSTRNLPYPQGLVDKASVVHLPVYMPAAYVAEPALQMVGDGDFYTVTIPLSQATVFMTGDRAYQQDSTATVNNVLTPSVSSPNFVRAEGMVSVDFNRHGANYTLSIECVQPESDERCMQTHFLQQAYADLVMVGGQP